jgi:hypothetical protein
MHFQLIGSWFLFAGTTSPCIQCAISWWIHCLSTQFCFSLLTLEVWVWAVHTAVVQQGCSLCGCLQNLDTFNALLVFLVLLSDSPFNGNNFCLSVPWCLFILSDMDWFLGKHGRCFRSLLMIRCVWLWGPTVRTPPAATDGATLNVVTCQEGEWGEASLPDLLNRLLIGHKCSQATMG